MSVLRPIFLYEDSGSRNDFGLHALVCACAGDHLANPRTYELTKKTESRPLRGDGNLRNACKDLDRTARRGQPVVAIFDADRVHRLLKLAPGAPLSDVIDAIKSESGSPPNLEVFVLERNLESVLDAIAQCHSSVNVGQLAEARRKRGNERDQILNAIANNPALRAVRDCIQERVPSLAAIVLAAARYLGPAP